MRVFKNRTSLILVAFVVAVCIIAGAVSFGVWIGNSIYENLTGSSDSKVQKQVSEAALDQFPDANPHQNSNGIKADNDSHSMRNSDKNDNINNSKDNINNKYDNGVNKNSGSTTAKKVENDFAKIEKMLSLINNAERIISQVSGKKKTGKTDGSVPKVTEDIKNAVPEDMLEKVEEKAQEISRAGKMTFNDYLEIFNIISGKLSLDEIKFLFETARGDYWEKTPIEDIYKAREILFSKLSDNDIEKLIQIGKKFGRSMDILKKDLDVEEAKKRQMENAGLSQ